MSKNNFSFSYFSLNEEVKQRKYNKRSSVPKSRCDDLSAAITTYNSFGTGNVVESLKQLKYIFSRYFESLGISINSGVLLFLLESSMPMILSRKKLIFDGVAIYTKDKDSNGNYYFCVAPGDKLGFFDYSFFYSKNLDSNLVFSEDIASNLVCGSFCANEIIGDVDMINNLGQKNEKLFDLIYDSDCRVESFTYSDTKSPDSVEGKVFVYPRKFYFSISGSLSNSRVYDFYGNELTDGEKRSNNPLGITHFVCPFVPIVGRDLCRKIIYTPRQKSIDIKLDTMKKIFSYKEFPFLHSRSGPVRPSH